MRLSNRYGGVLEAGCTQFTQGFPCVFPMMLTEKPFSPTSGNFCPPTAHGFVHFESIVPALLQPYRLGRGLWTTVACCCALVLITTSRFLNQFTHTRVVRVPSGVLVWHHAAGAAIYTCDHPNG